MILPGSDEAAPAPRPKPGLREDVRAYLESSAAGAADPHATETDRAHHAAVLREVARIATEGLGHWNRIAGRIPRRRRL